MILVEFDGKLARLAADLRVPTKSIGASIGDRACLALAQQAMRPGTDPIVYTAEHSWAKVRWPFQVTLIRPRKT